MKPLKEILLDRVKKIAEQEDPEHYCSGACATLSIALWHFVEKYHTTLLPHCSLLVLYRVEKDFDTDLEVDRVVSHVMLQFFDQGTGMYDMLDIYGWNADDRWCHRIDSYIEPTCENAYNDTEYLSICTPIEFNPIAKEYKIVTDPSTGLLSLLV